MDQPGKSFFSITKATLRVAQMSMRQPTLIRTMIVFKVDGWTRKESQSLLILWSVSCHVKAHARERMFVSCPVESSNSDNLAANILLSDGIEGGQQTITRLQ